MYFNPRSPDGERRVNWYDDYHDVVFQSTLPGWGATKVFGQHGIYRLISIHAPRMGSDAALRQVVRTCSEFQSTLPEWGATIAVFGVQTL